MVTNRKDISIGTGERLVLLNAHLQSYDEMARALAGMRASVTETIKIIMSTLEIPLTARLIVKAREGYVEWPVVDEVETENNADSK